ncbi:Hypothetical protein PHPALM_17107 [Phytophthora palmivora]|uniref:GPI inositol-deacylase n=1 Tax=Phytophthora palmivora TaxID=4796 RepID=A0A2P4XN87_9STRA|nr:Hypothetical protein PHPALM_17107 [Phytophthora palmivora]
MWNGETTCCCRYSAIIRTSDMDTGIIANTIVVTHSMGGLVMASALASGKCNFAESTSWVSISAPMMGRMAGDIVQDICNGSLFRTKMKSTANKANALARKAHREKVTAVLCSTSYHGAISKCYPSCSVMIPQKSIENDALVEFKSCLGGNPTLFGDSYLC